MPDSQLSEAEEDWLLYNRGWRVEHGWTEYVTPVGEPLPELWSHPNLPDLYSRAAALLEIQSQGGV